MKKIASYLLMFSLINFSTLFSEIIKEPFNTIILTGSGVVNITQGKEASFDGGEDGEYAISIVNNTLVLNLEEQSGPVPTCNIIVKDLCSLSILGEVEVIVENVKTNVFVLRLFKYNSQYSISAKHAVQTEIQQGYLFTSDPQKMGTEILELEKLKITPVQN